MISLYQRQYDIGFETGRAEVVLEFAVKGVLSPDEGAGSLGISHHKFMKLLEAWLEAGMNSDAIEPFIPLTSDGE